MLYILTYDDYNSQSSQCLILSMETKQQRLDLVYTHKWKTISKYLVIPVKLYQNTWPYLEHRGVLHTPDNLGLIVGICASVGLGFANFPKLFT